MGKDQESEKEYQRKKAQYQRIFNKAAGVSLFCLDPDDFKSVPTEPTKKEAEKPLK